MKINRAGIIAVIVMLLILIAVAVYILFFVKEADVQKRDNTPAAQALLIEDEDNSFTDVDGNAITVSEDFGKIIIVTSWASWCPQCSDGLVQLGNIASEYKERGVVILAVNRAEDKYSAQRYLNTITVSPDLRIVLDPSDHYFGSSSGYAMPETILYTKNGQEEVHQRGNLNADELKQHLDQLLK